MKMILMIVGVLALLMGLLWIGQGLGLIMWPASSFMLEQKIWSLWGSVLALAGVGLIFFGRRR